MILYMKYEKQIKSTTLVLQSNETIIVKVGVVKLLDRICNIYGDTYKGRRSAIMKELGIFQKIPILINASKQEIFFPICNLRKEVNYWINYRYIDHVSPCDSHSCWISFSNEHKVLFPVNIRVIKAQLKRCDQYLDEIYNYEKEYDLVKLFYALNKKK